MNLGEYLLFISIPFSLFLVIAYQPGLQLPLASLYLPQASGTRDRQLAIASVSGWQNGVSALFPQVSEP